MSAPIRLAVVDDSSFVRKAIARIFDDGLDVSVVGLAASGEELMEHIDEWDPTIVTLDLSMPGMGGLETLDRILRRRRMPVVILSGHNRREAPLAVEALHRGAADFIDKEDFSLVDFQGLRHALLERLRTLAQAAPPVCCPPVDAEPEPVAATRMIRTFDLVVVGASTGGPPAIERLLASLEGPPSAPMAIVQHMPAGFTRAFAERLNARLPFRVEEATHARRLLPGSVYIAPAGMHLRVQTSDGHLVAALGRYPKASHRPSVDVLFRSAASLGPRVLGVLLTGMGDDGARGLLEMATQGSLTIAQDEASCVVYGMPRAAAELGAVTEELSLPAIAARLRELLVTPAGAPSGTPRSTASR